MLNESRYNKGLSSKMELSDGKFVLTGGTSKIDDNINFWTSFIGWFRVHNPSYPINVYQFYQQSTSYLYQYKNNFRLSVLENAAKNLPHITVNACDLSQEVVDRKRIGILIRFTYKLNPTEEVTLKILTNV